MKNNLERIALALTILLISLLTPAASASAPSADVTTGGTAFAEILRHYEAVRLALTTDTIDGVAKHASGIRSIVDELGEDWTPEHIGVKAEMADEARALLPDLHRAASDLAGAQSLSAARDAFYALSKPMVRFRKAAVGDQPVVAYCPMVKRSWLQPKGQIGNPYYGQSMLRCGELIDG